MNVRWTPEAEQDRRDVWDYIAAARLAHFSCSAEQGKLPVRVKRFPHERSRSVYEIDALTAKL